MCPLQLLGFFFQLRQNFDILLVLRLEICEQVGAVALCPLEAHLSAPAVDVCVMSGEQHLRHRLIVPDRRLGVLRILKQTVPVAFILKAHIVGEFLLRTNRRSIQIMGYDMVGKNAECIKQGSISFLIAQHGYMQGYNCVDALFRAIVLKNEINPVNYMPIELLTQENVDFYQRTQV